MAIAGGIDRFTCAHCGAEQVVTRAGDLVSLELAGTDVPQVRTGANIKAAKLALPGLHADLAALEEEQGQLAATMPKRFNGSAVIGQFLLAVVVAAATVPAMPSGTKMCWLEPLIGKSIGSRQSWKSTRDSIQRGIVDPGRQHSEQGWRLGTAIDLTGQMP